MRNLVDGKNRKFRDASFGKHLELTADVGVAQKHRCQSLTHHRIRERNQFSDELLRQARLDREGRRLVATLQILADLSLDSRIQAQYGKLRVAPAQSLADSVAQSLPHELGEFGRILRRTAGIDKRFGDLVDVAD